MRKQTAYQSKHWEEGKHNSKALYKPYTLLTWQEIKYAAHAYTHQSSGPEAFYSEVTYYATNHFTNNLCCKFNHPTIVSLFISTWKMWIEDCFHSLLRVTGVCSPVRFGWLHTWDHRRTAEVVKGKSYLHPVKLFLMVSPLHQMAFLNRLQSESRPQDKSDRG